MSSISVNTITDASGGSTTSINGFTPSVSNMAGRNRIINGDMRIDQRNAGAAVTASGAFPVDRFSIFNSTDGSFSAQQDSSAPVGFVNSLKYTVTTADGTLTTNQNTTVRHIIEGTNVSDLAWGSASAKTVTLSFWVRSSLTGTFGGALRNSAADRNYPFTYTISSADTWEYKTVTISGDISGTWLTTTGSGIGVYFSMGAGPDRSGNANAWAAGNVVSAIGATSVVGTSGATFYITGVQLEEGSVATPFEHRQYGQELALCQRYYQTSYANGVQVGSVTPVSSAIGRVSAGTGGEWAQITSSIDMRATPSFVIYNPNTGTSGSYRNYSTSTNVTVVGGGNGGKVLVGSIDPAPSAAQLAFFHYTASSEL